MRKYVGILTILVLCFAVALWAQSGSSGQSGSTSSSGQTATPDQSTSGQAGQAGSVSGQTGTTSGQTGTMGGQTTEQERGGKQKSIDGCVVRQGSDYYLVDKRGDLYRLSATEDLSAHVGHHVRVKGEKASSSSESMGSMGTAGSTSSSQYPSTSTQTGSQTQPPDQTSSQAGQQTQPPDQTTGGQTGATGGVSGQAGTTPQTGAGAQSQTGAVGGPAGSTQAPSGMSTANAIALTVSSVQHISDTCPASIQSKITSMGLGTGASTPQTPQ